MKKPSKILIAYDGSKASDTALHDLKLAGLPDRCEVKILTVADLWVPPADLSVGMAEGWYAQAYEAVRVQSKSAQQAAKTLALKAQASLKATFPQWKISCEAVVDHPANGVLAFAEKFNPDLIVLGSHGHGALGRLFLGSVSLKVLHHAVAGVRVTRIRKGASTAPKIMAGVDGSQDSRAAIEAIASRNWPKGTKVHLVTAVDERMRLAGATITRLPKPSKDVKPEGWLQLLIESAEAALAKTGLRVTTSVLEGDAREVLLQEAKRWKPHCLFLGSRGLNSVQRFFLGSVSTDLVVHAPCTVEIIRPE